MASLHSTYDTGNEIWATIPYQDLFLVENGFSTRTINPDTLPLFARGGVFQEIPSGLSMRIWIEGAGGLAGVVTDEEVIRTGTALDKERASLENTAAALAETRIRTGTKTMWDTDFPFLATEFPTVETKVTTLHGRDPSVTARIEFARVWVNEWARTLARISPLAPIILEGFVVGAGFSLAPSASNTQKAQFFVQEAMILGTNKWVSWSELAQFGIPVIPLHTIPSDDTDVFQASVWNTYSFITPLNIMLIDGILFRPLNDNTRERFSLYRDKIHPFFRRGIS